MENWRLHPLIHTLLEFNLAQEVVGILKLESFRKDIQLTPTPNWGENQSESNLCQNEGPHCPLLPNVYFKKCLSVTFIAGVKAIKTINGSLPLFLAA